MSSNERPMAVALVHGVLITDPEFYTTPAQLLKQGFQAAFDGNAPNPDRALCIEPVHWAPVLERKQEELFRRMGGPEQLAAVQGYCDLIAQMNQGKLVLPRLLALFSRRWNRSELHWSALRWLIVNFIGDALAYPASPATADNYNAVHDVFARALSRLGDRATPNAPLVVLAHSLGSVVTSDFMYDLQTGRRAGGDTPLERGETLFSLHTLGSPLGLWMLRTDAAGLACPIRVPSPRLSDHHPVLTGGWYNYYDPDDIIATPLRTMSDAYASAVREDHRVSVGGPLGGATPLSHPFYWTDPEVMRMIGYRLAEAYVALHPSHGYALGPSPFVRRSWTDRLRSMIPPSVPGWKKAS